MFGNNNGIFDELSKRLYGNYYDEAWDDENR